MKQHRHGVNAGGVAKQVSHRNAEGGTGSSSKDLQGYRSVRLIAVSPHMPFETYKSASVHLHFLIVRSSVSSTQAIRNSSLERPHTTKLNIQTRESAAFQHIFTSYHLADSSYRLALSAHSLLLTFTRHYWAFTCR
jgi:hypothetical protein